MELKAVEKLWLISYKSITNIYEQLIISMVLLHGVSKSCKQLIAEAKFYEKIDKPIKKIDMVMYDTKIQIN